MILDRELKELMEYLENSSFVEFEIEREGLKLKLVRRGSPEANGQPAPSLMTAAAPTAAAGSMPAPKPQAAPQEAPDVHVVKSPIVGTFYRSSAPDAKPFVAPGDRVKKGQVLCIVEAMKLMNEIESDGDGEILDVMVANGQPVEFGEPLFRIRTTAA
jgi:acetyl-CoA carboxylase biotin carboxyl carrier protein